jgi:large subunit ribosomal protein L25
MKTIELSAQARTELGKNANRRTRVQGSIPAILYGQNVDPINLALDSRLFHAAISKLGGDKTFMCKIQAESAGVADQLAVIRAIQRDPVTERIIHLDLMRIDITKPIDIEVAVIGVGVPAGLRDGGVLDQPLRTVHLRCLPTLVPAHLEVNIAPLGLGQSVHVSDLVLPEGVEVRNHGNEALFHVAIPRKAEEVVAVPGAAEPEVIAAKKKEEAAAGAAAPKKK